MGMPVTVDVRGAGAGGIDAAFAMLREADAVFSTYRADSAISRMNRGELAAGDAGADVREVLERCEAARRATGGAFDVRAARPGALDPSGLVKGWAVDRACAVLERAGARDFLVDAGGDVAVRGAPAPGRRWRVGVRHPRERDRVAAVVAVSGAAVATSGAYERGEHVVDPATGRPPRGVLSVTVVGPELATADAYATAAFAMGADGPAWTATLPAGFAALTILAGDEVVATAGWAALEV